MPDADQLIADAMSALHTKLSRDGLPTFNSHKQAVVHALLRLHDERIEHLLGYWFDRELRLLGVETLALGGEFGASLSTRHIARRALANNADFCLMIHNHPNGLAPDPSEADIATADAIDRQLAAVGVMALGHHVVSTKGTADIRARTVTHFDSLPKVERDPDATYCPHCNGLLTTQEKTP